MQLNHLCIVAVVLMTACGRPTDPDQCAATCSGCCTSAGLCVSGDSVLACGQGGARCDVCQAAQQCSSSGRCAQTPSESAVDAGVSTCVSPTDAELCLEARTSCGALTIIDVCGASHSIASCGACASGETCTAGACRCEPETDAALCVRVAAQCGTVTATDNCGGSRIVSCGTCPANTTCGSGGLPNVCSCTPESDAQFCQRVGRSCGSLSALDNCGRSRSVPSCGACASPNTCSLGQCACAGDTDAQFCARLGATCGAVSGLDRCGQTRNLASCGTCAGSSTCGGGGQPNLCGCTPATDAALCAGAGKNCGAFTTTDNCGGSRTVSCGVCSGSATCGGSGVPNVCGACAAETDAQFCSRLGGGCGPLTGTDNCGQARTVAACAACPGFTTCTNNVCGGRVEPMQPVCGAGTCWENPLPVGVHLNDAETSPQGSNWVVGQTGTVLQWNGATWRGWFALTSNTLEAVWPFSDTDVWAVGAAGTVLHWNGTAWATEAAGTTADLRGVWGAANGTLWVVGGNGLVLRRSPAGVWSPVTVPTVSRLNAVSGTASTLWVVGDGVILGFDGTSWSTSHTSTWSFTDVVARGTDAFAVSNGGVARFSGVQWVLNGSVMGKAVSANSTEVVVSDGASRIFVFDGLTWTGTTITGSFTSTNPPAVGAATMGPNGEVLVAGANGLLFRRVAGVWHAISRGLLPWQRTDLSMTRLSVGGGGVFATGSFRISTSTNGVLAERGSGGVWMSHEFLSTCIGCSPTPFSAAAIAPRSARFLFPFSNSVFEMTDGVRTGVPVPIYASALDLTSASEGWLLGQPSGGSGYNSTLHLTGTTWTAVPNPVSGTALNLNSVSAAAPDDVWFAGSAGTLLHYVGGQFVAVPSPTTANITRVRARASAAPLAMGSFGVMRWNGTAWVMTPRTTPVASIWPESANVWWLVSNTSFPGGSEIRRWNGTQFIDEAPWAPNSPIKFVDVAGDGVRLWFLGERGEVLRRD